MIKTLEWRQWHHSSIFIVNFEHIPLPSYSVSIVDFEQVNVTGPYLLQIKEEIKKIYYIA